MTDFTTGKWDVEQAAEVTKEVWYAGYNMPGYMPDEPPEACDTFQEAKDHILWLLNEALEQEEEGSKFETQLKAAIERAEAETDEFGFYCANYFYFVSWDAE